MITSDEMLGDRKLPDSVIFIGGRHFAGVWPRLCARRRRHDYPRSAAATAPGNGRRGVAQLQAESERIGTIVKTSVSVRQIEPAGGRFRVIFTHDGVERAAEADRVVNGAGRIANTDTLDLAAGHVAHTNGRVAVDPYLRSTSNTHVHFCGDAAPISPQRSPIATYEGDIVGRNIVEGPRHMPDYAGIATSVYTVPALAAVGLTESEARVHVNDMRDWFSARSYAETVAWSNCRTRKRPRPRRAFCRPSRPGTHQRLRTRDQVRHYREPAPG
jgi:glutathione reductase (NADPH)